MFNACTKRYFLKPTILIITYYHSTLRMTASISPAGCPPITTLLALHFFIDILQNMFYHCVDVLHCFSLQESQTASADQQHKKGARHLFRTVIAILLHTPYMSSLFKL
jgi:hypothetical protein